MQAARNWLIGAPDLATGGLRPLRFLKEAGVLVTAVYLPHIDHQFDLAGTRWSPAARVAFYTLERFLAVISTTGKRAGTHAGARSRRVAR